jgi:hypothetical protein
MARKREIHSTLDSSLALNPIDPFLVPTLFSLLNSYTAAQQHKVKPHVILILPQRLAISHGDHDWWDQCISVRPDEASSTTT